MLNKNANCYNIEKNFEYNTVISTFSEHITIFRTLSIDIFDNSKTKKCRTFFFCKLFRITQFFFHNLLREATSESKVAPTNRNSSDSCYTLVRPFPTLSCFPKKQQRTFLELIFANKIKTMLLKQSSVLLTYYQINIAYIMCLNT